MCQNTACWTDSGSLIAIAPSFASPSVGAAAAHRRRRGQPALNRPRMSMRRRIGPPHRPTSGRLWGMRTVQNWAGNHSYAGELVSPTSLEAAAEAVAGATRVRPLGSRHSFNAIADSAGLLISLEHLAYRHPSLAHDAPSGPEPVLDEHTGHVRVPAATRYADLARFLEERGRTLPNFASLPHLSIAGSLATATHGSGVDQQVLARAVVEIGLVLADGTRRTFSRDVDGDLLNGVVVSLGALGLVHEVTLATVPAFEVSQTVYGPIPLAAEIGRASCRERG